MMKKIALFALLSIAGSLSLWSQGNQTPKVRELKDLLYVKSSEVENESLQRLNLVLPENKENFPLLIWIGGGAWSYVDRQVEMDLARSFAKEGIAVATVGHRLSPAVWKDKSLSEGIQHPKHIEDVAAAVAFLYKEAEKHGYNREKIFIGGFSSGAHLAALICMDNSYLSELGLSKNIIKGVIPISGAYDILDYYQVFLSGSRPELAKQHVQAVFGETEEALIKASPTHYLEHLATPMLLICDNGIYNYTRLFEDKIRESGFHEVEVIYSHNLSHAELWRDISLRDNSLYRAFIIGFIQQQLEDS